MEPGALAQLQALHTLQGMGGIQVGVLSLHALCVVVCLLTITYDLIPVSVAA